MKIALIYNRNQRIAMGERSYGILKSYGSLEISQFDVSEIQDVRGGFDLYLRIDDGDYSAGIPYNLKPYAWWIADTHLRKPLKKIIVNAKNCDYIFCCQKQGAKKLSKIVKGKVSWVPGAADELSKDFEWVNDQEKKWDICLWVQEENIA